MLIKMFCIYDCKAEAYLQPFFMKSKGEVIRAVTELCNDPKHNFSKYAADFTLFEIGSFDDSNGKVELLPTLVNIGILIEFKKDDLSQAHTVFSA